MLMATEKPQDAEPVTVEELIVLMNSAREHVLCAIDAHEEGEKNSVDVLLQTALRLLDTNFDD